VAHVGDAGQAKPHLEHNPLSLLGACYATPGRQLNDPENYRPIIAVHKWFARRPGTLFRALLLSEFRESTLRDIYFETNTLAGIRVADPFMGGGTPLLEANRLGCDVIGYDINPMAYWIVR